MATSRPLVRCPNPKEAVGQLGGHVKSGFKHPLGDRTKKPMALVSALPLDDSGERLVLSFLDRSEPVETFDNRAGSGDNAVVIVRCDEVGLSVVKGVCLGDWRGLKVRYGEAIEEPTDLDVDPTGLDLEASDAWVDLVDELGCDCSKVGGYPLWANVPVDVDDEVGRPQRFHHRLTSDLVDWDLGEGCVIYVFVDEEGDGGSILWQRSGGGVETTYSHY